MTGPIKFLTFNMQAAISTRAYSHYVTRSHRQLFNTASKRRNLAEIGKLISGYDVVCLQEVDLGGRRAGFTSQLSLLQEVAGFSHAAVQENRMVGRISRHGNAILARRALTEIEDIKLPARINGRGCLIASIQAGGAQVRLVNLHLSLGPKDQARQLDFIASRLGDGPATIVAGDFNCSSRAPVLLDFARQVGCRICTGKADLTYPAWKPRAGYDHILISPELQAETCKVLPDQLSDHLPLAAHLDLAA